MTAPVRSPAPRLRARAPRGAAAAAPATLRRAGAAAPNGRTAAPNGRTADPTRRPASGRGLRAVSAGGGAPAAAPSLRTAAGERPAPSLRLVDDRRLQVASRRRRGRALLVLSALLVVASLFGVVAFHAMLVSGQGRLDGLQQEVSEEQARYQALRLEVAELEAPNRIVEVAQGRLGMVSPTSIAYLAPVSVEGGGTAAPGADGDEPAVTTASAPWASIKPLLGGQG